MKPSDQDPHFSRNRIEITSVVSRLTLFILNMYCKGYVKYIKLYFSVLADGSADPDKMQTYAAFYLGLHCLNLYTE